MIRFRSYFRAQILPQRALQAVRKHAASCAIVRILPGIAAATLLVTACGQRGPLTLPPEPEKTTITGEKSLTDQTDQTGKSSKNSKTSNTKPTQ